MFLNDRQTDRRTNTDRSFLRTGSVDMQGKMLSTYRQTERYTNNQIDIQTDKF